MSHAEARDRYVILKAMARQLFREYGARAYQVFVVDNPHGRVPAIERLIMRGFGK